MIRPELSSSELPPLAGTNLQTDTDIHPPPTHTQDISVTSNEQGVL